MMIEAERPLIGRAGAERENPVALLTCPLLAGLDQGFANPTPFRRFAGREFIDIALVFARKVGLVRKRGKPKPFALVIFCDEDHRLLPMFIDTDHNPVLKRSEP